MRTRNRGAVAQRCAEVYRQRVPGNRETHRNTLSDIPGEQFETVPSRTRERFPKV
jgi:hypothetical protein